GPGGCDGGRGRVEDGADVAVDRVRHGGEFVGAVTDREELADGPVGEGLDAVGDRLLFGGGVAEALAGGGGEPVEAVVGVAAGSVGDEPAVGVEGHRFGGTAVGCGGGLGAAGGPGRGGAVGGGGADGVVFGGGVEDVEVVDGDGVGSAGVAVGDLDDAGGADGAVGGDHRPGGGFGGADGPHLGFDGGALDPAPDPLGGGPCRVVQRADGGEGAVDEFLERDGGGVGADLEAVGVGHLVGAGGPGGPEEDPQEAPCSRRLVEAVGEVGFHVGRRGHFGGGPDGGAGGGGVERSGVVLAVGVVELVVGGCGPLGAVPREAVGGVGPVVGEERGGGGSAGLGEELVALVVGGGAEAVAGLVAGAVVLVEGHHAGGGGPGAEPVGLVVGVAVGAGSGDPGGSDGFGEGVAVGVVGPAGGGEGGTAAGGEDIGGGCAQGVVGDGAGVVAGAVADPGEFFGVVVAVGGGRRGQGIGSRLQLRVVRPGEGGGASGVAAAGHPPRGVVAEGGAAGRTGGVEDFAAVVVAERFGSGRRGFGGESPVKVVAECLGRRCGFGAGAGFAGEAVEGVVGVGLGNASGQGDLDGVPVGVVAAGPGPVGGAGVGGGRRLDDAGGKPPGVVGLDRGVAVAVGGAGLVTVGIVAEAGGDRCPGGDGLDLAGQAAGAVIGVGGGGPVGRRRRSLVPGVVVAVGGGGDGIPVGVFVDDRGDALRGVSVLEGDAAEGVVLFDEVVVEVVPEVRGLSVGVGDRRDRIPKEVVGGGGYPGRRGDGDAMSGVVVEV